MSAYSIDKERIFNTAADLADADQRSAYLDEACGDNAALRAEIEELLRHDVGAGSFLEQPAVDFAPTIATGEFDTVDDSPGEVSLAFLEPSDKPGCIGTLEHYEVIELVGRGGMGLVLRAFDPKLNRVVAIKVMAPELAANVMAVKRFLREARAAAAVSHDHVVTIHAIHDAHRPPFIVMEFVGGQSLQEKINRQGGLALEEILRIGMQTARGLSAAHEQGLVHRDIKPANILLENGVERVKLTDFGLARAVDDVSVTQTGQIAGTPQFMSPEQANGHSIDARSDLFSLGSVLYTMCTGRPPFRAETAVAMLRRVTDDEPRSICEVNSEIPEWLDAITFKLLAKDPVERFQSSEEVAELLGQYLAHLQHPTIAAKPRDVVPPIRRAGSHPAHSAANETGYKPVLQSRQLGCFVAAGLAIVGCLLLTVVAGVVFFVKTNQGTIRVEVNDPNTTVTIDEMGINLQDAAGGITSLALTQDDRASLVEPRGMGFALIPAGEFEMGTAKEQIDTITAREAWFFAEFVPDRREAETPRHRVTISKAFEMSRHEVTVGQFRRFVEATGYKTTAELDGEGYGWRNGEWRDGSAFNWRNPGFEQSDDHPVCNVSWEDAVAFCRWLSDEEGVTYRLPTEAEWEYACRAGTTTLFSTGDDPASLQDVANLADQALRREQPNITWAVDWEDGYVATAPVGSFAPNAFGLYDMHGNVWEWCQDVYDEDWYETTPSDDPLRRGSGTHVFRGGGFDNWPGFLRSADRYSSHSETIFTDWAGFRVVREVTDDNAAKLLIEQLDALEPSEDSNSPAGTQESDREFSACKIVPIEYFRHNRSIDHDATRTHRSERNPPTMSAAAESHYARDPDSRRGRCGSEGCGQADSRPRRAARIVHGLGGTGR